MKKLLDGYRRFRANGWPEQRRVFESLATDGQAPQALVLASVDSRVDPAMIFHTAPGEMTVIRNVANLVPPYAPDAAYHGTSAALEFGLRGLGVRDLIVLCHGLCLGIQTLLNGAPSGHEFITPSMLIAQPALVRAQHYPLANLMTFPRIAERVSTGTLGLHGAWFDVHTGVLMILQPDGTFALSE